MLSNQAWRINWKSEPRPLLITGMQMQEYELRMLPRPKTYYLYRWIALKEINFEQWQRCQSLTERVALLERILTPHILAFARGVDWNITERLEVRLQNIQQTQTINYHGNNLLAFNVAYTANLLLPPHIALGKAVSHGFGWQVPKRGG